jgi:hypothetical protein
VNRAVVWFYPSSWLGRHSAATVALLGFVGVF